MSRTSYNSAENYHISITLFEPLKINCMPFINFNDIQHSRIWDGIHGALHHSDSLTFGHIIVEEGAVLPEHHHIHEQWTHVLDGELEFTIAGETQVLSAGMTAFIPSDVP